MISTIWLRNISLIWFLQMTCRWMVKRFKFFNQWRPKHKLRYVFVLSANLSINSYTFSPDTNNFRILFLLFYIYSCGEKITYLILLLLATIQLELIISILCPSGMLKCLDSPTGERIPLMAKEARVLPLFTLQMELEPEPSIKCLNTRILTLVWDMTAALLAEKRMPS